MRPAPVVAVAALATLFLAGCTDSKRPHDGTPARSPSSSTAAGGQTIPVQYLKDWGRHGAALSINADGTGEMSYRTYEESDGTGDLSYEHVTMRFRVSSDGRSLVGTVTSVRETDSAGRPIPGAGYVHVGDEFTYTLKSTGALNEHQTRPPGSAGDGDIAYCTTDVEDPACGA